MPRASNGSCPYRAPLRYGAHQTWRNTLNPRFGPCPWRPQPSACRVPKPVHYSRTSVRRSRSSSPEDIVPPGTEKEWLKSNPTSDGCKADQLSQ